MDTRKENELDKLNAMIASMIQKEEKNGKELQKQYRMLREQILYMISSEGYSPILQSRMTMLSIRSTRRRKRWPSYFRMQSATAVRAIKYIDENYTRYDLSLDLMARELHITSPYLCRLIKQQTGMNYKEYLTRLRMTEAKKLLQNKNISIADVCQQTGYSNVSHFIKTFQKYAGTTPTKYRDIR